MIVGEMGTLESARAKFLAAVYTDRSDHPVELIFSLARLRRTTLLTFSLARAH